MDRISMTGDERMGTIARGATAGVIGGTIFALAQIAISAMAGYSLDFPARMAASIWLGPNAFSASWPLVFLMGAAIHYAIAIVWGVVAAALYEWAEWPQRMGIGVSHMITLGALFGMFVWLMDMSVVAGNFLPWIWRANQPAQFLLHALFFGVPVGVTAAALARLAPAPALPAA